MSNLVFVILHYQNMDDTTNCIISIKELYNENYFNVKIIVVDNCSPNKSGLKIWEQYYNDDNIKTILLNKNYGFSIANNKGYEEALSYNPDAILFLNNDILIEDKKFLFKLKNSLEKNYDFEIISPDIINLNGNHQNPLKKKEMSIYSAYKNLIYEFLFLFLISVPIVRNIVINFRKLKEKKWYEKYYKNSDFINNEEFIPFGAFIIYTRKWIIKEKKAFIGDTFMYMEEDMLGVYVKNKGYKIIYDKELTVRHLEGQSTKKSHEKEYDKIKFRSLNIYNSIKKYINFLKKYNVR